MDDRRPSAKAAVAAADAAGMAVAAIASVAGNTEQTAAGLSVCRRCAISSLFRVTLNGSAMSHL